MLWYESGVGIKLILFELFIKVLGMNKKFLNVFGGNLVLKKSPFASELKVQI